MHYKKNFFGAWFRDSDSVSEDVKNMTNEIDNISSSDELVIDPSISRENAKIIFDNWNNSRI